MDADTDIAHKHFIFEKSIFTRRGRLVEVNVHELNKAWENDPCYIKPGGIGGTGNRYNDARQFLQQNIRIHASEVVVRPDCSVVFSDGRHRFCNFRDAGRKKVTVLMKGWQYWYLRHLLKRWWRFWSKSRWLRNFWYFFRYR